MAFTTAELFTAIQNGDDVALQRMLNESPALAAQRNEAGVSPVMWASYLRQERARELLLGAHPELDLFDAVAVGDERLVRELIDRDPSLAQQWSADGFTALHLAAFFAREAIVSTLLAAGADPRAVARNAMRVVPHHSSVAARADSITRRLLEAGAPVDAAQQKGWTALMSAGQHGDVALAELLLGLGADPHLQAEDGRSAIDLAVEHGHHALAGLLRSARAGD